MTKKIMLCENSEKGIALVAINDNIYAYTGGKYYSTRSFRPVDGNGRQLREDSQNAITVMLPKAREALQRLTEENNSAFAEALEKAVAERAVVPQKSFADALQDSFMASLTALNADKLLESVLPLVREKILDEYGLLPEVHEIRTPEREAVKLTGILHKDFERVLYATMDGESIYLYGPAGTGKSYMVRQIAESLGLEYYCASSVLDDVQLKGFVDANGNYHETEFYRAFVNGGVFMLDELDASIPDVLTMINDALSNGMFAFPNGKMKAHKDFHCLAAGNTFGTGADNVYTGRTQLDAATMNRFGVVTVDYDERIELSMANGDKALVDFARDFRKAVEKAGITCLCTYRDIKRLAKFTAYMDKVSAIRIGLTKGLPGDDIRIISQQLTVNNEWTKALNELASADALPF